MKSVLSSVLIIAIGAMLGLGLVRWFSVPADAPTEAMRASVIGASHSIATVESYQPDDYAFLRDTVADRRIVLLGENHHGVEEFSLVKSHIIRFLYEEFGFTMVAWEGGPVAFYARSYADQGPRQESPRLQGPVGGVWDTTPVRELVSYARSTHRGDRPLRMLGFDIDLDGRLAKTTVNWLETLLGEAGSEWTARLRAWWERDKGLFDSRERVEPDRVDAVESFTAELAEEFERIAVTQPVQRVAATLAAHAARDLAATLRFRGASAAEKRRIRDRAMAENLRAILELHPQERVVVWAHNAHVARSVSTQPGSRNPASWILERFSLTPIRERHMGEYLDAWYGGEIYVLGLFAYSGQFRDNSGRRVHSYPAPRPDALESLLHDPNAAARFVDLVGLDDPAGTEWKTTPWAYVSSFSHRRLVPARQFDGLLVVTRATPSSRRRPR